MHVIRASGSSKPKGLAGIAVGPSAASVYGVSGIGRV
jgi:hypothetical protein